MAKRQKYDKHGDVIGQTPKSLMLKEKYGKKVVDNTLKCDWTWVDAKYVIDMIAACSEAKYAVMFGTDRNGVGYTMSIFMDGEKVSKWFDPSEEGRQALYDFIDEFTSDLRE